MSKKIFALVLPFLLVFNLNVVGSQIMGSDITWDCIGKDSFLLKLSIYRDCNGLDMRDAHIVLKCNTTGNTFMNVKIDRPNPVDITPTCGASCTRCESRACSFPYGIQEFKYQKLVYLADSIPTNCCEVLITYSKCCRNSSLTNGGANSNFYTEAMLNRCVSPCDNSLRFTNPPIAIICAGQDFIFCNGSHSNDIDPKNGGLLDSVSYEWVSPLTSANTNMNYDTPYTYNKPVYFWGFPNTTFSEANGFKGLSLDKRVGGIAFRPMKNQQTVMSVLIKEWRYDPKLGKRTLIGHTRRDYQLIVITCPNNHSPELGGPFYKEVYEENSVNFTINSNDKDANDSLRLFWNAQIAGAVWSDNHAQKVKHPTGTFSWTPLKGSASETPYVFTVMVKDDACPVNGMSVRAYQILVKYPMSTIIPKEKLNILVVGNNTIRIEVPQSKITKCNVFNISGKLVHSKIVNHEADLVLNNFDFKGVHIVKVILQNGDVLSDKIILQ